MRFPLTSATRSCPLLVERHLADQLPQEHSRGLHVGPKCRAKIGEIGLDEGGKSDRGGPLRRGP